MKISKLFAMVALLVATTVSSQAAVIFEPTVGTLTGSVLTDFSNFAFYDVRGLAAGALDGGPGVGFVSDSESGTDPDFQVLSFGNLVINALTGSGPTTDIVQLTFTETGATIVGNTLTLFATGTEVLNNNNALANLVGGPLTATFLLNGDPTDLGNGSFLIRYDLVNISNNAEVVVPEPATFGMIGLALPLAVLVRRRMKK